MSTQFPTKTSEIKEKFDKFIETNLVDYSFKRNFDFGSPHTNVSTLSPYIGRRLISETDILDVAFQRFKPSKIEKFVQEIFWRTYWRGWLELHPIIWDEFEKKIRDVETPKKTGIKCFDHWTQELIETGYLHNHARMWYASIWIFTLKKNWFDGAIFFQKYLLDWCPAVNTLSWRWVAGLQTIGKNYIARADNINKFTNFKFNPVNELDETAEPIQIQPNLNQQIINKEFEKISFSNLEDIGLVINKNDFTLDSLLKKDLDFEICLFKSDNSLINQSVLIKNFENNLYEEIINDNSHISYAESNEGLIDWITKFKIKNLIIPYETKGKYLLSRKNFLNKFTNYNVNVFFYLREWDRLAFPYAKKGFFPFKNKIPELLKKQGLTN
tara:strand:- start:49 stop:1200 length:1152 start_codon:yes stop_codon:yes gene_type:complete